MDRREEVARQKKKIDTSIRGAFGFSMREPSEAAFYDTAVEKDTPELEFHDLLSVRLVTVVKDTALK